MNKGNLDMPDQQKQLGPQDHKVEHVTQQITQHARDDIPGLYASFLADKKKDPKFVKLCIDRCGAGKIPALFGKFTEDVKRDESIVNMALQKCADDKIPELFPLFTEDVKKDNSIVSLAIKQCRFDQIAALYDKLPKDQGRDLEIAKLFVKNCDGYPDDQYIPELFCKFKEDVKKDSDLVHLAFEKCSRTMIPALFGELTDDMMKDSNIAKLAIQKCSGPHIPELFGKFTEDVKQIPVKPKGGSPRRASFSDMFETVQKMDENIVNLAFQKCPDFTIPGLYAKLPEDQKEDLEILKLCEKCSAYTIADLFDAFPENLKSDQGTVSEYFGKSDGVNIQKIFAALPEDQRSKPDTINKYFNKCSDRSIPALFGKFTEDVKGDKSIMEKALQKCADDEIPGLYANFLEDKKNDLEIVKRCINLCRKDKIPELFGKFTEDVKKKHQDIMTLALNNCDDTAIPDLFRLFTEDVKKKKKQHNNIVTLDNDIVSLAIQNCRKPNIPDLFGLIPQNAKSDVTILMKFIEKWDPRSIPALFGEFAERVKKDTNIVSSAIRKCDDENIPDLLYAIPTSVVTDNIKDMCIDKCQHLIEKCDEREIQALFGKFRDDVKGDKSIVEKALQKCADDKIPELFGEFTEERKGDVKNVVNLAMNKCFENKIPELYDKFLFRDKIDTVIANQCIGKCRSNFIPDLFRLIPENAKSNVDILKELINKWDSRNIPALFGKFTEDVKKNDKIVNLIFQKCADTEIPGLVAQFSDKGKEEFWYQIAKQLPGNRIPIVFEALLQKFKNEPKVPSQDLWNAYFKECEKSHTQQLFATLPDEVKNDKEFWKKSVDKCDKIPQLFAVLPDSVKSKEICNKCLENLKNLRDKEIPEFFATLPENMKTDREIQDQCVERCPENDIPRFFTTIPEDLKMKFWDQCLKKCNTEAIGELFDALPDNIKTGKKEVIAIISKCPVLRIPRLFRALSEDIKQEAKSFTVTRDHGGSDGFEVYYEGFVTSVEENGPAYRAGMGEGEVDSIITHVDGVEVTVKNVVAALDATLGPDRTFTICVKKEEAKSFTITRDHEGSAGFEVYYEGFVTSVEENGPAGRAGMEQGDVDSIITHVDGVEVTVKNVVAALDATRRPDRTFTICVKKEDEDVKDALEKASLTNARFFEKYSFLFETLIRIAGASLVFLGPEFMTTFFQDHLKEFAEKHWIREDYEGSESWSFYPIEGCRLQPPQPFDVQLPFNVGKMFCLTAALSFPPRNLQWAGQTLTTRFERTVFYLVALYSAVVVPLAMISVVHHFFSEVYSGIEGGWNAYECFYASWNFGPYNFNYQLLLIRYFGSRVVLQSTAKTRDEEEAFKLSRRDVPSLRECLLDKNTDKREIERRKMRVSTLMPLIITVVPFAVVDIPFVFTHKLPAVFFFAGFVLAWLILVCIMTRITYPKLFTRPTSTLSAHFSELLEESGRTGYLSALPLLFGLSVTSDFLTLAPIYLYNGEGAIYSAVTFFTERSMHKYIYSLTCRVVRKVYSLSAVLSEIM